MYVGQWAVLDVRRERAVPSLMVTQGNFLPQLQHRNADQREELKMFAMVDWKTFFLWPLVVREDTSRPNLLCCQPLTVIEVDSYSLSGVIK